MSILEIILYSVLGIATAIYITITIIKWTKKRKKKYTRGGMRYEDSPVLKDNEDYEDED